MIHLHSLLRRGEQRIKCRTANAVCLARTTMGERDRFKHSVFDPTPHSRIIDTQLFGDLTYSKEFCFVVCHGVFLFLVF
jgi:hypothetical protein